MPSTPRLIKYWGGRFRPCLENWPEEIQNDLDLQTKVLLLVYKKYAHHNWGNMLPNQKFDEINQYVFSLLQEYF